MGVEERLRQMGIEVPPAPQPAAAYVPAVEVGKLVFISGQLPLQAGTLKYQGKVGRDLTWEEGYEAAKLCALNTLGVIKAVVGGDWSRVQRIVRLSGFVASAEGFTEQHKVINGASEFFKAVFDTQGEHARSAIGVNELPLGAAVELETIVQLV
ncbi:MAG: RidA family protein [Nitrospinota bacterium]|nr:MAG: RidA family protein [Nitrospinota bacterium]